MDDDDDTSSVTNGCNYNKYDLYDRSKGTENYYSSNGL